MVADSSERFVLLNELGEEFAARYRRGERPSLSEYIDRHPALADDIREFFPAMAEMEQAKDNNQQVEAPAAGGPLPALERLGDFRILREIGRGGMGVVYEAEQVSLGRHVALKVLPQKSLVDARAKQRFEREAKAAAKLHHTNIVPVFGVGEQDGLPYYVMQFIQGLGLDEVLKELKKLQPGAQDRGSAPQRSGGELRVAPRDVSAAEVARSLLTGRFALAEEGAPAAVASATVDHGPRAADDEAVVPAAADEATAAHVAPPVVARSPDRATPVWHGQETVPQQAAPASTPVAGRLSDTFSLSSSSVVLAGSAPGSGQKSLTYWQSAARIAAQVADALDYAHKQGVQHRDIKPSNLLLDTRGTVWITDFGLAKADDQQNLTHTGDILGTLRYMPPEAFEGRTDARGDIYGLGLTLYELLCLRPAFDERERHRLIKQVTTAEPARLERLNRAVPRDLVTIVHKAIERDPAQRYPTAAALAADLQRFLADEPIQARRQTQLEGYVRWARHHPGIAVLGGVLTAVLVLATVVSLLAAGYFNRLRLNEAQAARSERDARNEAETARNEALTARHASQRQSAELLFDRGVTLAEQGEAAKGLHWMLESLKVAPADAGDLRQVVRTNLGSWGEQVHGLWHILPNPRLLRVLCLAFSPDGKTFVTGTEDGLQLWNADTCACIGKPFIRKGGIYAVAFSPDGKTLLTGYSHGGAQRWTVATGAPIGEPLPHPGCVRGVAFSPDGKRMLTGGEDRTARLWDAVTGKPLRAPLVHEMCVLSVAFSPDGRAFITSVGSGYNENGGRDAGRGAVYLWDMATGKLLGPPLAHPGGVLAAAFSPDGQAILSGSEDATARLWDRATGKPKGLPLRHRREVEYVAFTPDGAAVLTGSHYAFSAFLWDTTTGQRWGTPLWLQETLHGVALRPDGRMLLTGGGTGGASRLWQISRILSRPAITNLDTRTDAGPGPRPVERLPSYLLHHVLAYSTDRQIVLTSDGGKIARLRDTHTGQPIGAPLRHPRPVRTVAFSADGTRVATSSHDMLSNTCTVHLWTAATGRPPAPPLSLATWVAALAFSPDGRVLATGDYDRHVRLWDVTTGKPVGTPLEQKGIPFQIRFSPDGKTLAVGNVDSANEARLWDVPTGRPVGSAMPHQNWVVDVSFSPDGKVLLTRSNDRTIRLWDGATGEPLSDYLPHQGLLVAAFSPDGKTIATGGSDDRAQLWDATAGQPLRGATLVHESRVTALAYSPDGRILGTGCADGSGRLWDVATFKPLGPPLVQRGEIAGVAFTPDGHAFLTTAADGTTRLWPVPGPLEGDLDRITLHLQVRTGMQMGAGQVVVQLAPRTWEERCRQLVALEGTAEGAYHSSVSEWAYHDARARDAEQDGATFTAFWHLDRLVALRPKDWLLYARRARAHSSAGQLDKADAEYKLAAQHVSPEALTDWYRHRVADCEAAGQDATARWYQDRVLAGGIGPDPRGRSAARGNKVEPKK